MGGLFIASYLSTDNQMGDKYMKIQKMLFTFFLLSVCGTESVLAEDRTSENSAAYTDQYGIVDAVYPEELRMVINDTSILYKHKSLFFKANGDKISYNKKRALPKGTPVIYQVKGKPPYTLRGLKIISMREYKKSTKNLLRL
jgi:hypothetical protein